MVNELNSEVKDVLILDIDWDRDKDWDRDLNILVILDVKALNEIEPVKLLR